MLMKARDQWNWPGPVMYRLPTRLCQ